MRIYEMASRYIHAMPKAIYVGSGLLTKKNYMSEIFSNYRNLNNIQN